MPKAIQQPWKPLPFEEARSFFGSKVPLTAAEAAKAQGQAAERAFVVSGLARTDMVSDVLKAMQDAIANGTTIDQFRKDIALVLEEKGWTGAKNFRVQTIFRTNIQSAYQAGKWAQFQAAGDNLPLAVYDAVGDGRTRPSHLAMDGRAFARNDPIWAKWWPPNGFNCRCTVRLMSMAEAKVRGVKIESGAGILRGEQVSVGPGRDQVVRPDPGFDHNPGIDFFGGIIAAATSTGAGFTAAEGLRGPKDFGLAGSIAEMPSSAKFPWPQDELLPVGVSTAEAEAAARARLGMTPGQTSMALSDVNGEPLLVPDWLVKKVAQTKGRERWAAVAMDVASSPSEVWRVDGRNGAGEKVTRKLYIKVFEPDPKHKTEGLIAVAETERGVWKELSVYPSKGSSLDANRCGDLVYARKKG